MWHLANQYTCAYYGSEGFDRPPSDVYSYGGGYTSAMTGLGRERLSPWYDVDCVCLFVFVCVLSSGCLVCRPSDQGFRFNVKLVLN